MQRDGGFSSRKIVVLCVTGFLAIVTLFCSGKLIESIDAGEVMVVQAPLSGDLSWYTTPGIKWQGFGEVTIYKKRGQFGFSAKDGGQDIQVRFNDSGHGKLSGSTAYELPLDPIKLAAMHAQYRSQEALEQHLIRPAIEKSIFLVGPLMSSKESVAERRNDLLYLIEDQIQNGVYRTQTVQEKQPDAITGQMKTVSVVKLMMDENNHPVRADRSPLAEFGLNVFNLSITGLNYDEKVEEQIQRQQEATMQVQLAIAKAKEAEQRAITVEKEGEADAAKAKWEQEVLKARAVTEAEQKLRVAELDAQAAEQFKLRETLLGEGEAARKKAVMLADGALTQKIDAWIQVCKAHSEAIRDYKGELVPRVVMGGSSGGQTNGVQQLMDLFAVKAAKDLELDMSINLPKQGDQVASGQR